MTDPLREAAEVMRAVRDRCVWTQQIDHRALVAYLEEEAAELIDAIETGSREELREELGDLLWQVLFHAEIASRDAAAPFDIDDVARGLSDKMIRRHPHVFAGETATTPEEVLVHWNAAKAAEKSSRTSILDGVSQRMPTLALAQKLLGKAARIGASPDLSAKVHPRDERAGATHPLGGEEYSRGQRSGSGPPAAPAASALGPGSEAELGEALLALVATARAQGWDAERALRERLRMLQADIRAAESGDLED